METSGRKNSREEQQQPVSRGVEERAAPATQEQVRRQLGWDMLVTERKGVLR